MARCSGSAQCTCVVHGGDFTTVLGTGSTANPYRINAQRQGILDVVPPGGTVNLTLTGNGVNPGYLLAAEANLAMGQLNNVAGVPTTGQVLAWDDSTSPPMWRPATVQGQEAGAVNVRGCLAGNGTIETPLSVQTDPLGGISCGNNGLALTEQKSRNRASTQIAHANGDQRLGATGADFRTMPTGVHSYTAPPWAASVVIDFEVQGLIGISGQWAGSYGRVVVRRSDGDHRNPVWSAGGNNGVPMWSVRPAGGGRGSTVGYRDTFKLLDVVGGETIELRSEMRATTISGGGDTQSYADAVVLTSVMYWSDEG